MRVVTLTLQSKDNTNVSWLSFIGHDIKATSVVSQAQHTLTAQLHFNTTTTVVVDIILVVSLLHM